jgi:hypothetical protein
VAGSTRGTITVVALKADGSRARAAVVVLTGLRREPQIG